MEVWGVFTESPTAMQWQIIDELIHFLMKYPYSLIAIPIVWIVMILVFQRLLHVHVSPWVVLITLVVSVGVVIGIILLWLQNNPQASMSLIRALQR